MCTFVCFHSSGDFGSASYPSLSQDFPLTGSVGAPCATFPRSRTFNLELRIDDLVILNFMLNIRQYFGHLSLTHRFLTLKEPTGSC